MKVRVREATKLAAKEKQANARRAEGSSAGDAEGSSARGAGGSCASDAKGKPASPQDDDEKRKSKEDYYHVKNVRSGAFGTVSYSILLRDGMSVAIKTFKAPDPWKERIDIYIDCRNEFERAAMVHHVSTLDFLSSGRV